MFPGWRLVFLFALALITNFAYGVRPSKHAMHTVYSNKLDLQQTQARGPEGTFLSYTRDDLARMKTALRKIPFEGSPLELLYMAAVAVENGYDVDLSWDELMPDLIDILLDWDTSTVLAYLEQETGSKDAVALADDDIPAPEDRQQTQGVYGCLADYDAYIGPLIKRWLWDTLTLNGTDFRPIISRPDGPNTAFAFFLDATGRRPTGLFEGQFHWLATLEECKSASVTHNATVLPGNMMEQRTFKGRYARLDMPITIPIGNNSASLGYALGVCVPDTCTEETVRVYLTGHDGNGTLIRGSNIITAILYTFWNLEDVYMEQDIPENDIPAKAAFGILLAGAIIMIIGTCYDGFGRHRIIRKNIRKQAVGKDDKEHLTNDDLVKAKRFLYEEPGLKDKLEVAFSSYSYYTSFKNIFTTRPRYPNYHIPALDGVRVLTIMWLVYGMTWVYGIVYFECWTNGNLLSAAQRVIGEFKFMPVIQTYYANTTLFFISGFVCVQMWYRHYKREEKRVSVVMIIKWILGRYLAIMPAMMGMLMVYTCLSKYITDGPMQPRVIQDTANCRETWWITMLLFHNVIRTEEQCFAWTSMYATVWQLNLVSIFILIPLVILPVAGYILIGLMYIAHIVILAIWSQQTITGEKSFYWDVLQTPWCNAGPYCIGMILAIIMKKGHRKQPKINLGVVVLVWFIALALIATVIYAPYDYLKKEGRREWSDAGHAAFDTLAPQMLSLGVAWITYACYYGYGGVIGDLLNWRFFTVVSKLALPMTMFMGPAMMSYFYARVQIFYIHEAHMGYLYHGHLIGVFIFGVVVALFFQHPIGRSMKIQALAISRLELLLHSRHPTILDQFLGDIHEDKDTWEKIEKDNQQSKPEKMPNDTKVVYKSGKPIGGFVPCQDTLSEITESPPVVGYDKLAESRKTDISGIYEVLEVPAAVNGGFVMEDIINDTAF